MPTPPPRPDQDLQPGVLGVLAACAFLLGSAVLLLDHRSGAPGHHAFLQTVGLVALAAAVVTVLAGPVRRHRPSR